jgi:hypothetical protein
MGQRPGDDSQKAHQQFWPKQRAPLGTTLPAKDWINMRGFCNGGFEAVKGLNSEKCSFT